MLIIIVVCIWIVGVFIIWCMGGVLVLLCWMMGVGLMIGDVFGIVKVSKGFFSVYELLG